MNESNPIPEELDRSSICSRYKRAHKIVVLELVKKQKRTYFYRFNDLPIILTSTEDFFSEKKESES